MANKFFYIDEKIEKYISYDELITNLNTRNNYHPYVYENDFYSIFESVIFSMLTDLPVVLLDYDFSEKEINNLGLSVSEINKSYSLNKKIEVNSKNFIEKIRNCKNWKLTLFTSGTTGIPKKVTHTFETLTRGVVIKEDKKDDIWGVAYNPTHIAGVQVFMQALLNMNTIIRLFGERREKILHLIKKYNITNISATPTFYRMLLPFDKEYESVKRITSGGEKFDKGLIVQLKKLFPNAKIINVYAATEFGTLFASNGEYFEIKPEFYKYVKVIDSELYVHKKLLGESDSISLNGTWYRTSDMVEVVKEKPLKIRFVNRKNEMINVGGYKVNPHEVEEVIKNYDNVKNCRVYGVKNSLMGNIVVADVVATKKIKEKDLRLYINSMLQPYKVPRIINFVDSINVTRSGKIKR
ncbi:AMP-dependent synthetase and ligase [Caldithrix abyssi DSM 13497]|uniref:AMP-binding enzyme C-terminal domain-containing protein n=2 Tax=Caldithrix abyssi TaxID=187145 RepID=H1XS58_CALAY|nr:fatty acid--CoA ligase family protein [Caldithrix abyssi]APF20161.1 AMP-binding enzyme C-terminal domain-containing protein [Caldithrix abyssi DSM 13497]EHO40222.1 AMP-dependent synthetase and ligase [Caldithrix abyssi DSM 13497]